MWAEGPQPAKRACLPQGLEEGARSAPQLLVVYNYTLYNYEGYMIRYEGVHSSDGKLFEFL